MAKAALAAIPSPKKDLSRAMSEKTIAKADQLRQYGRQTAEKLRNAARNYPEPDRSTLLALAHRIDLCNANRNTWIGLGMENQETGEQYDGFGRYWQCNSKLCSYCVRENARRNRLTLRQAINRQTIFQPDALDRNHPNYERLTTLQGLKTGEHYRFITLTIPNIGLDIPATRAIVNHAWSMFRKRLWFRRCVVGGAKAEEFTKTYNGYHYHLHIVARSTNIRALDLRREWTASVQSAFREAGQPLRINTSDGLCMGNVQIVHDVEKVANEVCKYITKNKTWLEMPDDALCHIALVPHWHRMFEVFGSFRNLPKPSTPEPVRHVCDADGNPTLFGDDAEPPQPRNHWRKLITEMPLGEYIKRLNAEFEETVRRRSEIIQLKFPWAIITDLEDPKYVYSRPPD